MKSRVPLCLSTYAKDIALIEEYIRTKAAASRSLRILEAGCGQQWPFNLEGVRYTLTGVDIDAEALEIRKNVQRDLDEIILGDLRHVDFSLGSFDVIYNSYVLEHIKEADVILSKFSQWLNHGGLLILLVPDPDSVRGFLTRVSPHWFHVFYYRHVLRIPNAGTPGHGPYFTYFAPVVSRRGIREFCERYDFHIKEERGRPSWMGRGIVASVTKALSRLIALLSFGRLDDRHADLLFILEKK